MFLGAMGVIGAQTNSDKINDIGDIEIPVIEEGFNWRNNTAFWNFINDNYISEQEHNVTKAEVKLNFDEITKTKRDIKNKFPQGANVPDEGQTTGATTPFLTLTMDKTEFLAGEIIQFRGMAIPTHSIQITLKLPDRTLEPIVISKTDIVDGQYTAEFQTKFDSPKGTWTAYARQLGDQTNTISFILE